MSATYDEPYCEAGDPIAARLDSLVHAGKSLGTIRDAKAKKIVLEAMESIANRMKPKESGATLTTFLGKKKAAKE